MSAAAWRQAVSICLSVVSETDIKSRLSFRGGKDDDVVRQPAVEFADEFRGGELGRRRSREADLLVESMDARVRTAGAADHEFGAAEHEPQPFADFALHGFQRALDLPAAVVRAVVGDDEMPCLHGIFRRRCVFFLNDGFF